MTNLQRPAHHLAQYNIARLVAPLDDPRLAGFVDELDRINQLGDRSPGFVWRHQNPDGNSTSTRVRSTFLLRRRIIFDDDGHVRFFRERAIIGRGDQAVCPWLGKPDPRHNLTVRDLHRTGWLKCRFGWSAKLRPCHDQPSRARCARRGIHLRAKIGLTACCRRRSGTRRHWHPRRTNCL